MTDEETSARKDEFFSQLAQISDAMTTAFDNDFAIGALILAARFIAESKVRGQAQTVPVAAESAVSPSP